MDEGKDTVLWLPRDTTGDGFQWMGERTLCCGDAAAYSLGLAARNG